MNVIQWHLMLNHVPVIGLGLVTLLFMYAHIKKSNELKTCALGAYVLLALIAIPVFLTGEPTENLLENSGVPVSEALVEPHEEAASVALTGILILGVLSLGGLYWIRKRGECPSLFLKGLLILSFAVSGGMAWTAHLGGLIRHTELRSTASAITPPQDSRGEEQ